MSSTIPPTLELKVEIREKVQRFLEEIFENIHRKVGQTVRFVCNNHITTLVMMNLPESQLAWDINGEPMTMDPSRVFYYKGNIDITDLTPSDTGVYECVVKWTSGNAHDNVTVGVYSLQVTAASTTQYIFEGEPLKLQCNSESLGRLFPAATRQWLFNDKPFVSLPIMLADNGSVEVISKIRKDQSGVWQCQVTHSRTGRVWDTAWMNVTVDDPPIFIARWYRHMAEHTGVVFAVIGLIIIVSFLIFLYSAYQIKRREDEADRQYMRERSGWEDLLSGFAEKGSITVEDFPEPEEKEGDDGGDNEDESEEGEDEERVDRGESEEDASENATARDRLSHRDENRSNRQHGRSKGFVQAVEGRKTSNRASLQGAAIRRASRGTGSKTYSALTKVSALHWLERYIQASRNNLESTFYKAAKDSLVGLQNFYADLPNSSSNVDTLTTSGDEKLVKKFFAGFDRPSQHSLRTNRGAAPDKNPEAVQGSSRGHPVYGQPQLYIKPWLSRHTYAVTVDHAGSKCDIKMKKLGRGVIYSRLSQVEDDFV